MDDQLIRSHFSDALTDFAAHIPFSRAVEGFPWTRAAEKVPQLEHSMWMLVEHIRIVNRDFIDWVSSDTYTEKQFPSGYWPTGELESEEDWQRSIDAASADLTVLKGWADDNGFPFWDPIKRRADHTPAREVILAIAHNAYHIAQIVDLRALLGVPVKDW